MTSTVYPVGGGMEDWAYGAGWDNKAPDAGLSKCTPQTEPALGEDFFELQTNVRSAIYLIETDDQKDPYEKTFGSRDVIKLVNGDFQIISASVEDKKSSHRFDGHINRNIRLATAMIDFSKPYIYVESIVQEHENIKVSFKVNGCGSVNQVYFEINGSGM